MVIFVIIVLVIIYICGNPISELYRNNQPIVIEVTKGLCNRLRVLNEYIKYATIKNKKLVVIWKTDDECNGLFTDFFAPIENVQFVKKNNLKLDLTYKGSNTYIGLCENKNKIIYSHNEVDIYNIDCNYNILHKLKSSNINKLKLLPYMQNIIDENIVKLNNNYIAIHVRRTDLLDKSYAKDGILKYNEYDKFLNKYKDYNIYIATDNYDTQQYFYKRYKNRIKVITEIKKNIHNNQRHTSLKHAIIDLYMCMNAKYFMGTSGSSFTTHIKNNMIKNRT